MNSKRKSRVIPGRSPRPGRPERNVAAEGVYNNSLFMHSITGHIGNTVIVLTQYGEAYEGIFRTFSSNFDIVIEMAHKVNETRPNSFDPRTVVDKLIFRPQDILSMSLKDVDLEFATKDTFQTDTAISKFNGQVGERELEPWEGPGCNGDEFELDGATANGWDVNDMFKKNEQMCGVTSTFDHAMPGYTTQIQRGDSTDYRDAEARATKIANEIENNPTYKARLELENGENEEEKFAAVTRPANDNGFSDKYVLPAKRKHNQQAGKATASRPPSSVASKPHHNHHPPPTPTPPPPSPPQVRNGDATSAPTVPKPQRSSTAIRTRRSYNSADVNNARYEPPTQPQQTTTQQQQQQQQTTTVATRTVAATTTSASSTTNTDNKTTTAVTTQSVQTTAVTVQTSTSDGHRISAHTNRGRGKQLNELKNFKEDFKLKEPADDRNKTTTESTANVATNDVDSEPTNKDQPTTPDVDKMTSTLKKSNLNPNAKEFVYNPNAKPLIARSPSTPTPSRPHTPQTPSWSQATPPLPPPHATMVMPAAYGFTTAQPAYNAAPNQSNRYRKVQMTMPSQMQVAAATGQPLLAPMHSHAHFTMPYSPQGHITPQPYQQMVQMVAQQGSGAMVPIMSTAINYHHHSGTGGGPGPGPQMQFIGPHTHHPYHGHGHGHGHGHPPPGASPDQAGQSQTSGGGYHSLGGAGRSNGSTSGSGSGSGRGGGSGSGNYPPPPHQRGPPPHTPPTHTFPMLSPILPDAPPPPPPPYHMMAAAQGTMQGYIHHHHNGPVGSQQPQHIQVIPHSQ
ncbi:ataxin-2-like protein [Nilaparvata lugens]|uniref:ataxin-2-like protein n=1 Tax=Nilaparvata lugens TaxID=108931 RepID=UPI00193D0D74|nr:ataxin-2-like protein [Nilaparvata lugens]XP_039299143.1 ataxin-2-like protein [Nilaparvata lugens]XP_039299149.1 ataxin-2-like protein [Nilaparvata lugens]XP_039299155.1 ataxin-2-like protein [Nilaparvata lugens]